jgi:hypothetical protein
VKLLLPFAWYGKAVVLHQLLHPMEQSATE